MLQLQYILCSYSSPYSMNSDHVLCSDVILWFLSLYFPATTLDTSVCLVVVCACAHEHFLFLFFMNVCMLPVLSVHLCVCVLSVTVLSHHLPVPPPIRVPGGECRQWGCAGGHGHPRDQCDGCERRAHAQRRFHTVTPWWPHPAWQRHIGWCLWGQPGPPISWLQHAGSGGQEAEVCKADGGEWGFWVSLHSEEPVLRSCPSFPLPHSWGNLGNRVWGRGLKSCMNTSPFTSCAELHQPLFSPHCTIPLSNVIHSFTLPCGFLMKLSFCSFKSSKFLKI